MDNRDRDGKQDWKPEWTEAKTFESGPAVVAVLKSNHRTPAYRLVLNFKHTSTGGDRRVPSYQPRFEMKDGKAVGPVGLGDAVGKLWDEALAWATEEYQKNEDIWLARKARQGQEGGQQRPGLKSLAKQDKKKWEQRQAAGTGNEAAKASAPPEGTPQ